jgi:hypothetical protein
MKATDSFKTIIQSHLEGVAANDPLFAETFKKPAKNIDDCITYILNTVQKSGCAGFADEEIFNMAVHYYDEDDIAVGKPVNAKVVVNHHVEAPATIGKMEKVIASREPAPSRPLK